MSLLLALMLVQSTPANPAPPEGLERDVLLKAADLAKLTMTKDDGTLDGCLSATQTDPGYTDCYGSAIDRADKQLNVQWKKLMSIVGGAKSEAGQSLIKEQRAWIAFKEESCNFYWGSNYGSMHRTIIGPSCRLNVYQSRIAQIDMYITNLSEPE